MELSEYEQLLPHVQIDGMIFNTPNMHCKWRIETLYTKEPDTIAWLNEMKLGEVLYDVGANIGQYSVYAAKRGVKVYSFEPESQNYAILCRNIVLNKLKNCEAYPVCLVDRHEINTLRLSGLVAGGSCHTFGENIDYHGNEKKFEFVQGSISIRMNHFMKKHEKPDHIKIDVDGLEHLVLQGATSALPTVKTILCEMDSNRAEHVEWINRLTTMYGFKIDLNQIEKARRTEGAFKGIGNIIFRR